jgi:hypothetical protein
VLLGLSSVPLSAEVSVLTPAKDNTIYEDIEGSLSNGSGAEILAGISGTNGGNRVMRALLAFDLSSIPDDSTIESVTLQMLQANPRDRLGAQRDVSLHRVLNDWGEGASIAVGGGGGGAAGAPAADGDATWLHTFFSGAMWQTAGGDFAESSSASIPVLGNGVYTWGSTPEMIADVQAWLDDPSSNFGWLVKGDEVGSTATAKRFVSRDTSVVGERPTLTVVFTPATGETPNVIFPHVFNLDNNNNTYLYVQNLNDEETNDVTVKYVGQNGVTAGTETKILAVNGSARFRNLPSAFVGVAQVFCSEDCTATGTWNFGLAGQGDFAAGISPMDPMKTSTVWAAPIPLVGPESGIGIAVYNMSAEPTSCSAFYYAPDGTQAAVDNFPSAPGIPAGGQTAFNSPNVPKNIPPELIGPDGFEGNLILICLDPVIPVIVNQDRVNGFPTPITLEQKSVSE